MEKTTTNSEKESIATDHFGNFLLRKANTSTSAEAKNDSMCSGVVHESKKISVPSGQSKSTFLNEMNQIIGHFYKKSALKVAQEPIRIATHDSELNDEANKSFTYNDVLWGETLSSNTSSTGSSNAIKPYLLNRTRQPHDNRLAKNRENTIPTDIIVVTSNSTRRQDDSEDYYDVLGNDGYLSGPKKLKGGIEKSNKSQRNPVEVDDKKDMKRDSRVRRVSFSTVEVRQYERIIGDHPCCVSGPPLSIGWKHDTKKTRRYSLDDHDSYCRNNRPSSMRLSCEQRISLLLERGVQRKQVDRSIQKRTKEQRKLGRTTCNLYRQMLHKATESAKQKIKNRACVKKERSTFLYI
uniref:Uncharacterized protein n=1 Tax=Ditylum brightwellii TaxID=49249 RepID=A0A7S4T570_9STRA|mmetsp:Transcript_3428/g.4637  ORF Transcript_3428/g.4637 Transcript_3428/m.4637 type:complete len:351 (-) Transcript_3428:3-1055(-)